MEAVLIWLWNNGWLFDAACEVVALLCMAGAVILVRGRKVRVVTEPAPAPARIEESVIPTEPVSKPRDSRTPAPAVNRFTGETEDATPQRSTVQAALRAMDRWETNYRRPSRGIAELARLAGARAAAGGRGGEQE